jgi:hypothetical protein
MKYVMLVFQDEAAAKAASEEQMAASLEKFNAFHTEIGATGKLLDGVRLRHSDAATTVRVREDQILTTDGPFAETKERLAGFYLFQCDDLDEAIEIAAQIPTAVSGSIEIRPVHPSEEDA